MGIGDSNCIGSMFAQRTEQSLTRLGKKDRGMGEGRMAPKAQNNKKASRGLLDICPLTYPGESESWISIERLMTPPLLTNPLLQF